MVWTRRGQRFWGLGSCDSNWLRRRVFADADHFLCATRLGLAGNSLGRGLDFRRLGDSGFGRLARLVRSISALVYFLVSLCVLDVLRSLNHQLDKFGALTLSPV